MWRGPCRTTSLYSGLYGNERMFTVTERSLGMAKSSKQTYKIINWTKYNESLFERGSITFWFDEDVVAAWGHAL